MPDNISLKTRLSEVFSVSRSEVLEVQFGKITIRMYSKGEHVLRIEVVVNVKDV